MGAVNHKNIWVNKNFLESENGKFYLQQAKSNLVQEIAERTLLGTSRNHDDDGNGNVKKAIGLMSKTTNLHVHHAFLYISLPLLHNYDVK